MTNGRLTLELAERLQGSRLLIHAWWCYAFSHDDARGLTGGLERVPSRRWAGSTAIF